MHRSTLSNDGTEEDSSMNNSVDDNSNESKDDEVEEEEDINDKNNSNFIKRDKTKVNREKFLASMSCRNAKRYFTPSDLIWDAIKWFQKVNSQIIYVKYI